MSAFSSKSRICKHACVLVDIVHAVTRRCVLVKEGEATLRFVAILRSWT